MADDEDSAVLGVIGGSGLYDIPGLADTRWRRVASPFGEASDEILLTHISQIDPDFCRS